jgi:hypothetical protein
VHFSQPFLDGIVLGGICPVDLSICPVDYAAMPHLVVQPSDGDIVDQLTRKDPGRKDDISLPLKPPKAVYCEVSMDSLESIVRAYQALSLNALRAATSETALSLFQEWLLARRRPVVVLLLP